MTTMHERPLRILAAEDSENDFRLAMRQLRKAGFAPSGLRVQDLPSLRQALLEGPWDAMISDFSMPGFSGLEALAEFRNTGMDIPFIFVSGTIGEETAVAAMQAGANDYVMKENLGRLGPALERELAGAELSGGLVGKAVTDADREFGEANGRHRRRIVCREAAA